MPCARQRTAVSRWELLWLSVCRDAQLLSLLVAVVGLGKPDNGVLFICAHAGTILGSHHGVMRRLGLRIIDRGGCRR
jgi:hypothetical protein